MQVNPNQFAMISQCDSMAALNLFIHNLGENPSLTSQQHKILQQKVIDIYEKEKKSDKKKDLSVYRETIPIIFSLQKLRPSKSQTVFEMIFGKDTKIKDIENECFYHIRENKKMMDQLVRNYDGLAKKFNRALKSKDWAKKKEKYLHKEMEQLKFLNLFLNMPWSKLQEQGNDPIPLWSQGLFNRPAIQNIKRSAQTCQTLEELLDLAIRFDDKQDSVKQMMTKEAKEKIVSSFLQRARELLSEIGKKEIYRKTSLYWQAAAALHILEHALKEIPSQYKTEFQNLMNICIVKIRNDPGKMAEIEQNWNAIAEPWNDDVLYHCIESTMTNRLNKEHLQTELGQLRFSGLFLGLSLNESHENKMGILPIVYEKEGNSRKFQLQQEYNFLSSLINYEFVLRRKQQQLSEVNFKLMDPLQQSLSSPEEVRDLNQQKIEIESQLCTATPAMLENTFQSLIAEMDRVSTLLDIKLTTKQKTGIDPLPIIGAEEKLPLQVPEVRELARPMFLSNFNMIVEEVNKFIQLRRKEQEFYLLRKELENLPLGSHVDTAKYQRLKALEIEVKDLRRDAWYEGNERLFERKLAYLLYLNHYCQFVTYDEEQKKGLKELPLLSTTIFEQIPDDTILAYELINEDPKQIGKWSNYWPQEWTNHIRSLLMSMEKI